VLRISVNGLTQQASSGPENWGELLNLLESDRNGVRQIVTAVRFGGVAVPTFREPIMMARELREVGPIDIETSSVDYLLHVSARAAYDSIVPLKTAAARIAARLRSSDAPAVARDIPRLITSVQTLTTLTAALGRARSCTEPHRSDFDALVLRLCGLVEALIALEVTADWNGVATQLDAELVPTLDAWVLVARRVWSLA
jgi:hypothetical protein